MEKRLILTVGLPRSGKSTWAKMQGKPIVNRDAIRLSLHGHPYAQEAEAMVSVIEELMVDSLFLAGHKAVIVDACHTTQKRRERWEKPEKWKTEQKVFAVGWRTCLDRAIWGANEPLANAILRMARETDVPQIIKAGGEPPAEWAKVKIGVIASAKFFRGCDGGVYLPILEVRAPENYRESGVTDFWAIKSTAGDSRGIIPKERFLGGGPHGVGAPKEPASASILYPRFEEEA